MMTENERFWVAQNPYEAEPCIEKLEAEVDRLRPLAEKWVKHLESVFEQSGDDGAAYHDWQAALAALKGETP